jgi:hypothetical protein
MMRTMPLRFMILHFSHIGFTEGLTFISNSSRLFVPPYDPAFCQVIRRHFDQYFIAGDDPDEIHPELP